ncbi:helix-turn-helix transcriptional regulator [Plantactinospora sp. S1510]|uniref:Helix-turn-helix transcriptional regulator n=1 Tax=Plantactinospora alkalitolerans TaxID=2789879 RepID=A0ABS0HAK0_9ACTN|nr:helix-turn-helix transcriptional regulator [Plantactinospora alkalitolerans]MBF9135374.1 helix-turn-helix transcriptional regulator [Plantactinospora alkalitolerans]
MAHGSPTPDGTAIRRHRHALGISQSALARKTGYSSAYLCQIENGLAHTISPDALNRIQRALGNPDRKYLVLSAGGRPAPRNPNMTQGHLADAA